MSIATIQNAFSAGEISPQLFGRTDLAKFHLGASTLRNCFVNYRGGAMSRGGSHFVGQCKQPVASAGPPRLIRFQFNILQGYVLEWGDKYVRFIANGAYITETPIAITGISQANPATVSLAGTPFTNGDWVFVSGVLGMPEVNGQTYIVAGVSGGAFTLVDLFGVAVDSTAFGAYVSGGTVARIYTLTTPYAVTDLPLLKYTQSADSMSLTHSSYPPYDLRRIADANWTLTITTFSVPISAPTGCTVSTSQTIGGVSSTQYQYVVTAVDSLGEESVASNIGQIDRSIDIATQAGSLTVTWTGVSGAVSYNLYKAPAAVGGGGVPAGSLFGFAGTALGTQFVDSNITQDFVVTPPLHVNPFAIGAIDGVLISNGGANFTQSTATVAIVSSGGSGAVLVPIIVTGVVTGFLVENGGQNYNAMTDTISVSGGTGSGFVGTLMIGPTSGTYPGVVTYFQQRRVYGNTPNDPDTYYMSQPGAFTNFDASIPTKDDDAIVGSPWSLQVNGIQFMVPMSSQFGTALIVMTGLQAWQLTGGGANNAITPASQQAAPQAFSGCSNHVPPIVINYDILYVPAKGSQVRDLSYSFFVNIFTGTDMTVLSSHLFLGHQIREWDYAEEPYKIVWAVRDDGILLSFTYLKEQDVYAWARHDTG